MGYLVAALMVLLGLFRKKSKLLTYLYGVYFWALIALNTFTADYGTYKEMYLCCFEPRYAFHEPGYMTICRICLRLGLSYIQFRMVISAIIVILIIKGLRYYTESINYALAIYLMFPFVGLVSGLRNATSTAILIYAFHFLFQDGTKALKKYILSVAVAMLFHYCAVFYFVFIFVRYRRIKIIETMACVIVSIFAIIELAKEGVLYRIINLFTNSEKVLNWFVLALHISPIYILTFIWFIILLWMLYRARMIMSLRQRAGIEINKFQKSNDILKVAKMVTLSLLAYSGAIFRGVVFLRLLLSQLPICYAIIGSVFVAKSSDLPEIQKECRLVEFLFPIWVVCVALFVFGYWIGGSFLQVYQNNLLFSWM